VSPLLFVFLPDGARVHSYALMEALEDVEKRTQGKLVRCRHARTPVQHS
jgi:hypothetical protein